MYVDLKKLFWLKNMKTDIAEYVPRCDVYNHIKAGYQRPAVQLTLLDIAMWKWEDISFIVGLPHTPKGHDSIWVIVDSLATGQLM